MIDLNVCKRKTLGAYYTPDDVARTLIGWAVREAGDRLLDPSCGDGQFLAGHNNVVGVDFDPKAIAIAAERVPHARLFAADFFSWAGATRERFECAAGNPPFIRYQRFSGDVRQRALRLCRGLGVRFSELTSSWAPFLVVASSLLRPGGRIAFVVPAEIGHCTYAKPLLEHLLQQFGRVALVAIREKVFPELSEDVWLLYAEGYGSRTEALDLHISHRFDAWRTVPKPTLRIGLAELQSSRFRVRPFLVTPQIRALYDATAADKGSSRLGELAQVGIGYVTGANDFFHLRPSIAAQAGIPDELLFPAVRSGRSLKRATLDRSVVRTWLKRDDPVLLLRLAPGGPLPDSVRRYLDSPAGRTAREAYKCRVRDPWYVIPSVNVPDGFLSYMSGEGPTLVQNTAGCVGTNSVHLVCLRNGYRFSDVARRWSNPFTRLSCELEGHPLGGGMLKLEPGEASRIVLPAADRKYSRDEQRLLEEGLTVLRAWRHYV